ncbi:MAG: N-acetylglucosamine-6-phosphate deacetylase [Frankia sp.]
MDGPVVGRGRGGRVSRETLLTGARVVTPAGVLDQGWVRVREGRITAVGTGSGAAGDGHQPEPDGPPGTRPGGVDLNSVDLERFDLDGAWLLPGFIDLHMHGGGGHGVAASREDMAAAVAFHRRHGTTRTLVSLVTAPLEMLTEQLGWIADLIAADPHGPIVGAHLEGPFLSAVRCGAQAPEHLRSPDRAAFAHLVRAGRGTVRSITIAPELPGALDIIADAVAAGVVAAVGHTDATYDETAAALAAGATLATHLFNGMRPLRHRDPGPVGAALAGGGACARVNDGGRVHPSIARLVASDPRRLVLVTDAIDAAGAGDGDYLLGGQPVRVRGGEARLARQGRLGALRGWASPNRPAASRRGVLAGSTLTMDDAVRRAVVDGGLTMEVAAAAAAKNPARVLGLSHQCGAIAAGLDADFAVLDADLRLVRVMARGEWSEPAVANHLAGAAR